MLFNRAQTRQNDQGFKSRSAMRNKLPAKNKLFRQTA